MADPGLDRVLHPLPAPPMSDADLAVLQQNRRVASAFEVARCEREAARNWDRFYHNNRDKFFRPKNWTDREFEQLRKADGDAAAAGPSTPAAAPAEGAKQEGGSDETEAAAAQLDEAAEGATESETVLLEVGCGPGAMLFPALRKRPQMRAHACDFSSKAIELVLANPTYDPARMNAFVADLTSFPLASTLMAHPFGRPTLVSLIFVLSAIPPRQHAHVMRELARCLPLGGSLIFRDFAHGDLSQLRYHMRKDKTWLEPSLLRDEEGDMAALYRRGDNTFTTYFRPHDLERLAELAGFEGRIDAVHQEGFNRKTGQKLPRRFLQANWRKVREVPDEQPAAEGATSST